LVDDHLLYDAPPLVQEGSGPRGFWDAWMLLAALAEATERVTLGPLVACASYRSPALIAKMADTLDEISGGRLILGLGAGWHQAEYRAYGYPFDHLASRFEEALQIIVPLLRTGYVDFEGTYYQARECELRPRGPRAGGPPIWIGANGPRMLRQVATYADAFNAVWHLQPESLAPRFDNLVAACQSVGRDSRTIRRTTGSYVALTGGPEPAAQMRPTLRGTPEEVAARLHAFTTLGVDHVTLSLEPWNRNGLDLCGRLIAELHRLER
jgi:alkanesulfonate monooxygenase SsuD/methylene tetrahydromethanopterin reductase-like flavin-dependent oxidoreductase (luciferase family)